MLVLETSPESDFVPYSACAILPAQAALVLAPHPDDEVFGCGGAIARHVSAGVSVSVVVLTDGALYGDATVRQLECGQAAKVLGYGAPEFWNYPDRGLVCCDALVQRLVEKIAKMGADLVYAPSPWEVHPDHRQAHMLAVEAVRHSASNVRLALYEVGAPLRPNVLLDITALVETKKAAMCCFESQLKQQNYVAHMQALNRYRTFTLGHDVLSAEAYWLVSPQEFNLTMQGSLFALLSRGTMQQTASTDAPAPSVASVNGLSLYQRFNNWRIRVFS